MHLNTFITGTNYRPITAQMRKKELDRQSATADILVHLEREPLNEYDSNAIQVLDAPHNGEHLGYIPAKHNEEPARVLDLGVQIVAMLQRGKLTLTADDDEIQAAAIEAALDEDNYAA